MVPFESIVSPVWKCISPSNETSFGQFSRKLTKLQKNPCWKILYLAHLSPNFSPLFRTPKSKTLNQFKCRLATQTPCCVPKSVPMQNLLQIRVSQLIWGHFKRLCTRSFNCYKINTKGKNVPSEFWNLLYDSLSYLPVCEYESVPSIILHDAILWF